MPNWGLRRTRGGLSMGFRRPEDASRRLAVGSRDGSGLRAPPGHEFRHPRAGEAGFTEDRNPPRGVTECAAEAIFSGLCHETGRRFATSISISTSPLRVPFAIGLDTLITSIWPE